ncbi:cysteine protease ATG4A-like isoform X2 [Branchiostoma floridae]|uniref:Cysteine protease n=1 Tax=Branchiostoma floridae TaxID=7739 RepID=A0A9J7M4R6_BRAFL|nr:cysteine protease ATG4A-like isoform X2 [Branchiostoma floridae]
MYSLIAAIWRPWEVCVTYEAGAIQFEEFPKTKEPAWILGVGYNTVKDRQELQNDISSRLWFTYRKNFTPIGGTGPMSDQGWGCMLRCGQMMLGQALICRHLGRDWRWKSAVYDNDYTKILQLFLDKKDSCYSIHQIAQMGVSEGKSVGQWFGPNTVAQVLKKLALFEDWSSLAIHVAMDNTVIIDDIKKLCRSARQPTPSQVTNSFLCNGVSAEQTSARSRSPALPWQPLMLIIPLRLGLSELNPVYTDCLKACFTLRQSLGMIGGKPNHAHYFIGYVGNSLVYLDPHTTQPAVELEGNVPIPDSSFHCSHPSRMNIQDLDPSIALGFFCQDEADFADLCENMRRLIIGQKTQNAMFEVVQSRPAHWPPYVLPTRPDGTKTDFTSLDYEQDIGDRQYDSDEEFEIL